YNGESFYSDKMQPVLDELNQKNMIKVSEGAQVVDLEEYGMPPCLLVRADGGSLYATRDMAAAFYRKANYHFDKCLYVVAYQQNLHFKQFFKVIELMGYEWAKDLVHVAFGMVSLEEGGSMSTRHGKVVFLEDVLKRAIQRAGEIIHTKNPDLENADEIAEKVGVGAIVFSTLYGSRIKDITFSYDRVLNFDGETGPYVQYTYARCNSVLSKAEFDISKADFSEVAEPERALITILGTFPSVVRDAATKYEPSFITRLMVDIAQAYNKFYFDCRIIGEAEGVMQKRLALTKATMHVLKTGLGLIGVKTVERM
ncbi:MAG: arginine--tRNA ligase, partial [Clostridia bacterium]|nr:arginine--tRNA ligase [Clostridia bacterium]